MKLTSYVIIAVAAALSPASVQAQSIVLGIGRAEDGDTLLVGDTKVRLFGIDAPEFDQTCKRNGRLWNCGADASEALMQLVTGKDVECISTAKDQYGRTLGRCSVGGTDINRTMVELGYAVAYRRYSSDYVAAEQSAKTSKLGLWAGTFEAPEQYRRNGGLAAEPRASSGRRARSASSNDWAQRARANCNIKGNRNRRGEWIYHLPGMPYYDQTRPEEIFCTEGEAQAAGYRRAFVR